MRTWMVITTLALGVALGGCAATGAGRADGQPRITRDTPIRCPACGVEFPVGQGLDAYEKAR